MEMLWNAMKMFGRVIKKLKKFNIIEKIQKNSKICRKMQKIKVESEN